MCLSAEASFTARQRCSCQPELSASKERIEPIDVICHLPLYLFSLVFSSSSRASVGPETPFQTTTWCSGSPWLTCVLLLVGLARLDPVLDIFFGAVRAALRLSYVRHSGGMLGAVQYFPYFAHEGWLVTKFFPHAISYHGTLLFDFIMRRQLTYAIYLFVIIAPLLTSSDRHAQIFGILISIVVIVTYLLFWFAYISAFCFGGALMSLYIVYMLFREPKPEQQAQVILQ